MKIGIVGAGATGLAIAYYLHKKGHQITIFEQAPFVGGQASTFDTTAGKLERGYHHLFTSDEYILNLITDIGLSEQMAWSDSRVGNFANGSIYDFATPIDLLKYKPMPLIDRLRIGFITLYLQRLQNWNHLENVTAVDWLSSKVGRKAYDSFWKPMLKGKFGSEYYDKISMAWIWGKFHTRFASRKSMFSKEQLGYPICTFSEIFEVLKTILQQSGNQIHLSKTVRQIHVENGEVNGLFYENTPPQWTSPSKINDETFFEGDSYTKSKKNKWLYEDFDNIIVTAPSNIFSRLLPIEYDKYIAELKKIEYLSAVVVILILNKKFSDIYWMNITDESIPFVGLIEQTNLLPPKYYKNKHVLYLANYMSKDNPMYQMDGNNLLNSYLPHLKKINSSFDQTWIEEAYNQKIEAAQPIITSGYSKLMPSHSTPIKGLYLANTSQIYPEDRGTNYSIQLAKKIEMILY